MIENDEMSAGFRREYVLEVSGGSLPERDMLPFAHRQDCDDVAGFVVDNGEVREAVIEIHLTYRGGPEIPGYPQAKRFASFWEWLKSAIDDSADWCGEEELADLKEP
ncbi:MAG: hypothetical protein EOO73_35730 [Myxococcales bacterium]|nr:MAG: hypothetical protein EOO73_35730 [Myxococcales bacterium]